jgi:mono/diheme cytochrome c family protein
MLILVGDDGGEREWNRMAIGNPLPSARLALAAGVAVALVLAGCGAAATVSSGRASAASQSVAAAPPTPTAGQVAYVPPSAAKTVEAQFALTPHPTPTETVVPTVTPVGAKVSFAAVQQLLTGNCAGCHPPNQGMDLTTGHVYANIVNVKSREVPSLMRVKPGDPTDSYLYQKVTQAKPMVGVRMPKDGQPLTADEITTLRVWIAQGANQQ